MAQNSPSFFHISSLSRDPCFQNKEAHAEAMRTTLCPGCAHPRPTAGAIDVWIQEERSPEDKPLNTLYGCGIGLIHDSMLELLGPAADHDLYLGRVYNDRDQRSIGWHTFHGRRKVVVRGSKEAGHRACEVCARTIYFARGKQYLCPAPAPDVSICTSDESGLVLPRPIADQIRAKKWRRVAIEELPVLDDPPDGFGVLPYRTADP